MSKILKNSLVVSILGFVGAFLNFISQIVIAGYFGAGAERDAFFAASVVPTYINTVVLGSIGIVFLPALMEAKTNKKTTESTLIAGVTGSTLMVLVTITICLGLFAGPAARLFFPGFDAEVSHTTASLLVILCPAILFQSYTSVLTGIYHAEGKFIIPSIVHLIPPVTNVVFVVALHDEIGILALALGTSVGFTTSFLIVQLHQPIRYTPNPLLFFKNAEVSRCVRAALPWLIGGFIYRGNTIAERMVASQFPEGVVSYLGYVGALITTLSLISMNGIGTTIFPKLAEAWASRDLDRLRLLFAAGLKFTFALCVPIIVGILAFNYTMIKVLFERGAFTPADTEKVSALLAVCTASFLFMCINTIPGKILAATGTSRLAVINGVVEVVVYVTLAFVLSDMFSYWGICYAQILSTMCSVVFASVVLQIRFRAYSVSGLLRDLGVILVCGAITYLIMTSHLLIPSVESTFGQASMTIAIIFGGLGIIVYGLLISVFIREARPIIDMILNKFRKWITG